MKYLLPLFLIACTSSGATEVAIFLQTQDEQGNQFEIQSPLEIYELSCGVEIKNISADLSFNVQIINDTQQEELFSFASEINVQDQNATEAGLTFLYEPEEGYPIDFPAQTQLTCIFSLTQEENSITEEQAITFE